MTLLQPAHLVAEHVDVPARIKRELVIGDDVGPLLRLGHRGEADGGDVHLSQQLGRFASAMTGDDRIVIVDQHRIREPEGSDAVGDLPDLALGMGTRITWIGVQASDRT
jgi:hypothetical protein